MALKTPLGWIADRIALGPRAVLWGTTASVVVSILVVLGGGVVRVTGSGLGCPTWPECDVGSLSPTPELGIHGLIEFANRTVTGLLIVAVAWAIIAIRLQRPYNRALGRLAWSQFWLVVLNAVAGGITVLTGLNPWVVALHFVLAVAMLSTATVTWHRAVQGDAVPSTPRLAGGLSWGLVACTLVLVLLGTLVTGSGPHSGDSAAVPRMTFAPWADLTVIHATVGTLTLVIAIVLAVVLVRSGAAGLALRRVGFLLVVIVLQAAVGTVQALTALPAALVALHVLGAALVWIGAVRVLLDTNPRLLSALSQQRGTPVADRVAA